MLCNQFVAFRALQPYSRSYIPIRVGLRKFLHPVSCLHDLTERLHAQIPEGLDESDDESVACCMEDWMLRF